MGKCRVYIVDDHQIFRVGMSIVLGNYPNISIVGDTADPYELLDYAKAGEIDVVFMDIKMNILNGIQTTRELLKISPRTKVIALSMFGDQEYFHDMINAGASGFLLKNAEKHELYRAVEAVMRGENYFSDSIIQRLAARQPKRESEERGKPPVTLTNREHEILQYIVEGFSNQQIADKLHISIRTVQGHRANVITKTGVKNSCDLVLYAVRNNLVHID